MGDILEEPWAKKITREVISLRTREKGVNRRINGIRADIGDRCLVMKKKLGHGEYGRWLKKRVEIHEREVRDYAALAEFRSAKRSTYSIFADFDCCKLERIAAVPLSLVDRLTPDTVLPVPGTHLRLALREMVSRQLDDALDAFEGRRSDPVKKATTSLLKEIEELKRKFPNEWQARLPEIQAAIGCPVETPGDSKEELTDQAAAFLAKATARLLAIPKATGKFSAASKEDLIEKIEEARRAALKTPAWATPRRRAPLAP